MIGKRLIKIIHEMLLIFSILKKHENSQLLCQKLI